MFNLVSLLVAALVSLQCIFEANAQIDSAKIDIDNNLQPNVAPTPKRKIRKNVHIFLAPPETAELARGEPLELECQVYGSPSPMVSWLKNGEPIVDYEEDANEIFSSHPSSIARMTSKLIINTASNGDVFTCVATAGIKQQTASTTVYTSDDPESELLMLEKLLRLPMKPVITSFYNEIFQEIGTNIVLPCRVYSYGKAQVYWQDNKNNIVYGSSRLRVLPSGDLMISGLRFEDMGQYTCNTKNMYGRDSAETFLYTLKA